MCVKNHPWYSDRYNGLLVVIVVIIIIVTIIVVVIDIIHIIHLFFDMTMAWKYSMVDQHPVDSKQCYASVNILR